MLATAGPTAEPNWLTFLEEPHGYPGGDNSIFFQFKIFKNVFI